MSPRQLAFDTLLELGGRWGGTRADTEVGPSGVDGTFRVRRGDRVVYMDTRAATGGRLLLWHIVGAHVIDGTASTTKEAADFIEAALGPATGSTTDDSTGG